LSFSELLGKKSKLASSLRLQLGLASGKLDKLVDRRRRKAEGGGDNRGRFADSEIAGSRVLVGSIEKVPELFLGSAEMNLGEEGGRVEVLDVGRQFRRDPATR
jgi:hypothetical protein